MERELVLSAGLDARRVGGDRVLEVGGADSERLVQSLGAAPAGGLTLVEDQRGGRAGVRSGGFFIVRKVDRRIRLRRCRPLQSEIRRRAR